MVPKGPGANPSLAALAGNDNVAFKPLVKHVVSKELILFFDKIRAAILDDDPDPETTTLRKSAFESVRQDPGLHQLVPYFINYATEKVTHSLDNTFVLHQMMELIAALIDNKSLFIDPYVASLVPPVLTCLLGHKLGPDTPDDLKAQFQLRDLAASLIGEMSTKYADSSHQLRPRLARTCLKYFLDPSRSSGEHYGAINGISALGGPPAVRSILIPNIKPFEYIITKSINERGQNDESVRMVIAAIIKAITSITDTNSTATNGVNGAPEDEGPMIEEFLGSVVGSRIVALGDRNLNKVILDLKNKEAQK